jgi:thiol-disulfide isomerase/thioredoxin
MNMNIKWYLMVWIVASTVFLANAQEPLLRPLSVGDTVPPLKLPVMVQYHKESVSLSEFRGRFLLLDFWSTSCKSCIQAFPKLEKLQKDYGDRLTILPVSFLQPKERLLAFLQKREQAGHTISLPSAVYPTLENELSRLFPSDGYPHIIWISPRGVIQAITGSAQLTEQNIRNWITSGNIELEVKNPPLPFNRNIPLLLQGNGGSDTAFSYRSLITPYINGIRTYLLEKQVTGKYIRLFIANASVTEMLKECMGWRFDTHNKQMVFEVKNPAEYNRPSNTGGHPKKENLYCYDLVLPSSFSLEDALGYMQQDISRYFAICAAIEKRKTRCWVLNWNGETALLTKAGPPCYAPSEDGKHISISNRPVATLLAALSGKDLPLLVDETGISCNIDIDLELAQPRTAGCMNEKLSKYGLYITESVKEVEMLVIRPAKK